MSNPYLPDTPHHRVLDALVSALLKQEEDADALFLLEQSFAPRIVGEDKRTGKRFAVLVVPIEDDDDLLHGHRTAKEQDGR